MGLDYLWDTNTVIYYLQNQFPPNAERFMDSVLKETRPVISAITEIELLCWKTATALANDLTLITRNTKDFERINKIKLVNPFDA